MLRPAHSLRVALLTYRGNPHSGGQGVYIRYLSKALTDLGHEVTVFSGQPYPDLRPGVLLEPLPGLDLYRSEDPFRRPKRHEFRDAVDVLEYGMMCTAAFSEPLTFSLRAARLIGARRDQFDIIHDNQCLGYGLLALARRLPLVATVHHPCSVDKRVELAHAPDPKRRISLSRWYSFTRMQARVARRLPRILCVSETGRDDVIRDFGVDEARIGVVANGVDVDLFRPLDDVAKIPGRVVTTASADAPIKGLIYLVEALAKVRTEQEDAHLVVVGRARPNGVVARAIERFGLEGAIRFETGIDWLRLVELYAEAEVAVVPSLYEGFSLPAVEAMSAGVPLVATRAGALPEVLGGHGAAGLLVEPQDPGELAAAILTLLTNPDLRARLGAGGRRRALDRFSWKSSAEATVDNYRATLSC